MPSFFSERTAEYTLVPILQNALKLHFGSAIPMFYWKTREGNRLSLDIHNKEKVRVLAMFARRPKMTKDQNVIEGKINIELIQFAKSAQAVGINVISAFPAVKSLMELNSNPEIFWLPLGDYDSFTDIFFHVDINQKTMNFIKEREDDFGKPISLDNICRMVEISSQVMMWDEAIDKISKLRNTPYDGHRQNFFSWFGGYRPVYFLIKEN